MNGYSREGRAKRAVVDEAAVRRIRQLAEQGCPTRELADTYGLTPEAVRRIVRWDTWRWVSEEGAGFEVPLQKALYQPAPGEVEASLARLKEKLAGTSQAAQLAQSPSKMPTMEESLAAAARESDEVAFRVAATFAVKDAAGNAQLAGLLNPGGIQSTITDEHGGKLEPKG